MGVELWGTPGGRRGEGETGEGADGGSGIQDVDVV